jgi:tripartite-type tricarboxylate transporter receptor subunit TctC
LKTRAATSEGFFGVKRWLLLAAVVTATCVSAQDYPGSKPITLVVPFSAGGPTDRVARDFDEALEKSLPGANFVIENVNGASGTIGAIKVARAKPDGHTLLLWHVGLASTVALYRKLPYQPLQDFEYLGLIDEVPMTLIGRPQLPVVGYRDFERYVKSHSGQLNLAHAGLGSASHLCGLMWQSAIGAKETLNAIPFGGTAPAMTALVGGQVDVLCDQTTNTTGQIGSGRVKAFAVTSAARLSSHPLLKDYPSLQELGLRGFSLTIWHGLYAPKGTPPSILKKLNQALKLALQDPEFIKKQEDLGAVVVTDQRRDPAGHKAFVAAEIAKFKPVIEAAGKFAD